MEEREGNFVPPQYWRPLPSAHAGKLIARSIMNVTVASFTFQFASLDQIRDYLAYYERKTHSSSMEPIGAADHWEVQRWFEKLPMFLLEESKRLKVVKALKRAVLLAEAGAFSDR